MQFYAYTQPEATASGAQISKNQKNYSPSKTNGQNLTGLGASVPAAQAGAALLGTANDLHPAFDSASIKNPRLAEFKGLRKARKALSDRDYHVLSLRATARKEVGHALQGRGYGMGWCGLLAAGSNATGDVSITPHGFRGVKRCGGAYCPVCGRHAAAAAQGFGAAAINLAIAEGHRGAMITLTQSHSIDQPLEETVAQHMLAKQIFWRRVGNWVRFGRLGSLDALEATYSANGWHVHTHALTISRHLITEALEHELKEAWVRAVSDAGGVASMRRGLRVDRCKTAPHDAPAWLLAIYAGKGDALAWEIAGEAHKRSKKGSLTPTDLLALSATDATAKRLACEYFAALSGKRKRFSPGKLAQTLGLPTMAEYADLLQEIDDVLERKKGVPPTVAVIQLPALKLLCQLYRRAELLLVECAAKYEDTPARAQRVVDWVVARANLRAQRIAEPLPELACVPLVSLVSRHERELGTWTFRDWREAANDPADKHHDIAQVYASIGGAR